MRLRRRLARSRGAVVVVVSLVLGYGVLLGAAALVVDVGNIYEARERLQTAADSAAYAVGKACAAGNCANANGVATQRSLAQQYVSTNATVVKAGLTADAEVCGSWGFFASSSGCAIPLNGLSHCLNAVPATPYVEVHVRTHMANGSTALPPTFAKTIMPNGYNGKTVTACARITATSITVTTPGQPPAAVWAKSTTNYATFATLALRSSTMNVSGLVHSESDVYIDGSNATVQPRVEYATNVTNNTTLSSISTPTKVTATGGPAPGERSFPAYRPGGTAAVAAGSGYYAVPASSCAGGTWTYSGTGIPAGATVVYVPCAVTVTASLPNILLAAEGTIWETASSITIGSPSAPANTGLLSNSSSNTQFGQLPAIWIQGSLIKVYGLLQASNGLVVFDGSNDTYTCGVIGNEVLFESSNLTVSSNGSCGGTTTTTNTTGGRPHLTG